MKSKRQQKSGSKKPPNKRAPVKLRVIGGEMGGRIIEYHGDVNTRPMKDNVRESLFNILGFALRGAKCFDFFAGTGALGFEAISRGAHSVVLVEQNRKAADVIAKNIDSLDAADRCDLICGDGFNQAGKLMTPPLEDTPWIVFLSPPYVFWQERLPELNRIIQLAYSLAPPGSRIVAETRADFETKNLLPAEWDVRRYGETQLAITEPVIACRAYL